MANNVYVCGTLYHIYISILKNNVRENEGDNSLLIVTDFTPNLEVIAEKLVANGFFSEYLYVPFFKIRDLLRTEGGFFMQHIRRNKYVIEYVENNSEIKSRYDFIKNSNINLFSRLSLSSVYFLVRFKDNNFRQIEDGLGNYYSHVSNLKAFKRKFILNTPQGEGRDPQVKTIEVQQPERLPQIVRHKGVKLDLKGLVNSLSQEKKQKIFNIFAQDNTLNLNCSNKLILITQPFSEDKKFTEEYKIALYNKILNDYASGYNIFIKAHPREKTIYKGKFDLEIQEIPHNFPLEILNFYPDIIFEKGITIFSGALNNLDNVKERIFLGMDYDKHFKVKKKLF